MNVLPHAYYVKILNFFGRDHSKAWEWFNTFNPSLCAVPMDMIRKGREKKLMCFIDSSLEGNFR